MKVIRQAKLEMYKAVEKLGDHNPITIALFPEFNYWFDSFKFKMNELRDNNKDTQSQESISDEYRLQPKRIISRMVVDMAAPILEYARSKEDDYLKELLGFSYTDLLATKDEDLIAIAQNVHHAGMLYRAVLVKYGIVPQVLTLLQAGIDDYTIKITKLEATAEANRKIVRKNKKLYEELEHILISLDKAITAFKITNPNFVLAYTGSRLITDKEDFFSN